jgi:hypothetical protein
LLLLPYYLINLFLRFSCPVIPVLRVWKARSFAGPGVEWLFERVRILEERLPMSLVDSRRRSFRLPLKVAVILAGKDYEHQNFSETAETVDVGKFGAKILTSRRLRMGALVSLRRPNSERTESFRVVYLGQPDPETHKNAVGLELSSIEDFWGHTFPPDNW